MSNHYHAVLRVDAARAHALSDDDVLRRWTQLFTGPVLVQRYLTGVPGLLGQAERDKVGEFAQLYRQRLADVSWFMRVLNETLARQANAEDGCTGRFWEGRFKSQALLDEQALLATMAYVDLNPIRAGMVESLQDSAHTSIAARLAELQGKAFAPVRAPVVTAAVAEAPQHMSATAGLPAQPLPSLLPEAHFSALPKAPLMPFDPTGRFEPKAPKDTHTKGPKGHPHKSGSQRTPILIDTY